MKYRQVSVTNTVNLTESDIKKFISEWFNIPVDHISVKFVICDKNRIYLQVAVDSMGILKIGV